ncbi:hypothetical protein CYMTET_13275 [Cymbomonas tetramitiformis]|uniref:Uncharacterized protein n=1 Tax=Cymbomonas tetramitiformis TaxID=36881 RepID=A0AAE0GIS4_9CHLO|nr:hypothetical protein CYMTET_13275 [Cymbomonas tetramitiformis]
MEDVLDLDELESGAHHGKVNEPGLPRWMTDMKSFSKLARNPSKNLTVLGIRATGQFLLKSAERQEERKFTAVFFFKPLLLASLRGSPAAHSQRALAAHRSEFSSVLPAAHRRDSTQLQRASALLGRHGQSQQQPPLQLQQHSQAHTEPSLERTYNEQQPSRPPAPRHTRQIPSGNTLILITSE